MTLQQLRYFETACRCGSISRAAQQLHVSQPSISMAIHALEESFAVKLIIKRYQGFSLTKEGEILLEQAVSLLRHADSVEANMQTLGDYHRPVRLGIPPMIGTIITPKLYQSLNERYPEIKLFTKELGTKSLINDLRENILDLAFISSYSSVPKDLEILPIVTTEVVWCACEGHPLAQYDNISTVMLANEPLVFLQRSFTLRDLVNMRFQYDAVEPNILYETAQLSTLQRLIHSGTASSFLLRLMGEDMSGVVMRPLVPPLEIQISLAWRRNVNLLRDAKQIIKLMQEHSLTLSPSAAQISVPDEV